MIQFKTNHFHLFNFKFKYLRLIQFWLVELFFNALICTTCFKSHDIKFNLSHFFVEKTSKAITFSTNCVLKSFRIFCIKSQKEPENWIPKKDNQHIRILSLIEPSHNDNQQTKQLYVKIDMNQQTREEIKWKKIIVIKLRESAGKKVVPSTVKKKLFN